MDTDTEDLIRVIPRRNVAIFQANANRALFSIHHICWLIFDLGFTTHALHMANNGFGVFYLVNWGRGVGQIYERDKDAVANKRGHLLITCFRLKRSQMNA